MMKEPIRERTIGVTMTFKSVREKNEALQFLNIEGRKPASYMVYLLTREMERSGRKVIGKPVSPDIFGA